MRQEDQQDQAGSSKIQQAEKSSAATTTATTDEQIQASRQTERARTRPAAAGNKTQAGASTSDTPKPTAVAAPAISAADEQPTSSFGKADLSAMPSAPGVSDPGASTPVIAYSGPTSAVSVTESEQDVSAAQGQSTITDQGLRDSSPQTTIYRADATTESAVRSTTFTPIRVLLLIAAALALACILAFAICPSRFRRWISAFRTASSTSGASSTHEAASLNLNHAIAEQKRPATQIDMTDELKQNLRQVLQTLETQLRGDVEFEEAPLQRRSRKPAWG